MTRDNVIDLAEHRDAWMTPRQRLVRDIVQAGEAECGLCGDLGCVDESTGEGVPCVNCGRAAE
jgi:hypothetical protein